MSSLTPPHEGQVRGDQLILVSIAIAEIKPKDMTDQGTRKLEYLTTKMLIRLKPLEKQKPLKCIDGAVVTLGTIPKPNAQMH